MNTPSGAGDPRPLTILVVEDEILVRMVAVDVLTGLGFDAVEAGDAREALQALETRADIQVIVTDVDMPGAMDGFGLARVAAARWPRTGILVTSGRTTPQATDLPARARFLAKPYSTAALLDGIRRVLDGTAAGRYVRTDDPAPKGREDAPPLPTLTPETVALRPEPDLP